MSGESEQIERLLTMGERLMTAVEADIVALKSGRPQSMRTTEPEMQRLSALYGREAKAVANVSIKNAPPALRNRLLETTAKFRDLLQLHARMITRVRSASEGMIKAIADEVDRQSASSRTYSPPQSVYARPAQAMIYNSVI